MLVAIPSKGRAMTCRSHLVLPSAVCYVPAREAVEYKAAGVQNIVEVPDEIQGITPTRNWILNSTSENWVVFLDDDVKQAGFCHMMHHRVKHRKISNWIAEFARLFEVTEDMGYRIWGISTQSAARSVYPYKPFLWRSYITASCMGVLNSSEIRFDEDFTVKEDYEMCLRCIKEDGGVVAARYLYWENSHWTDDGGCKDYRTSQIEKKAIAKLKAKYPGMVRQIDRGGSQYSIELNL